MTKADPSRTRFLVGIRVLEPKMVTLGPVVLKCYVPAHEEMEEREVELKGAALLKDAAVAEALRLKKSLAKRCREGSLVIVEVSAKGFVYRSCWYVKPRSEEKGLLFPSPARLIRLGVFRNGSLEWYKPDSGLEVYVYEGWVDAPNDVKLVIMETEEGSRVLSNEG